MLHADSVLVRRLSPPATLAAAGGDGDCIATLCRTALAQNSAAISRQDRLQYCGANIPARYSHNHARSDFDTVVKAVVLCCIGLLGNVLVAQQWAPVPSQGDTLERAAAAGDTVAWVRLAVQYWWGVGRAADRERALGWAMRSDDPLARFIQAECLADWRQRPPQLRRADSLAADAYTGLRMLASQGNLDAMVALAEYYRRGLGGIAPNEDSATALLDRAITGGSAIAAYHRAAGRTDSVAQRLIEQAANGNVVAAMVTRARTLLADSNTTGDAVALLQRAERYGSPEAALLLGGCYESGLGVERNPTRALQSIALAADRGSASAMLELSFRLLHGIGTPADTLDALVWLLRALAQSSRIDRQTIVAYAAHLGDSLPMVARRLGDAVRQLDRWYDPKRLDSATLDYLLTGDGVRIWRAWWRPSLEAPEYLAFRHDGRALLHTGSTMVETGWLYQYATHQLTFDGATERTARIVALADGLCAIEWNGERALYAPINGDMLRREPLFHRHEFLRPLVEILPPRTGDDYVRLRFRVKNTPRSGLIVMPLGLARDRSSRSAEIGVRSSTLWRFWDDGVQEMVWQPIPEDIPPGMGSKCVLFVQCIWQYEGSEQSMIVKSQPFAVPIRWQRR